MILDLKLVKGYRYTKILGLKMCLSYYEMLKVDLILWDHMTQGYAIADVIVSVIK